MHVMSLTHRQLHRTNNRILYIKINTSALMSATFLLLKCMFLKVYIFCYKLTQNYCLWKWYMLSVDFSLFRSWKIPLTLRCWWLFLLKKFPAFPSLKHVACRPYIRYLKPGSPPAKGVSIWLLLSRNKLQTPYRVN